MHKLFLHFHETLNRDTNVVIDYKGMAKTIAQTRKLDLKESFGESEGKAFFRLMLNGRIAVEEEGRSIKTLRKKAYKKLLNILLDLPVDAQTDKELLEVYEKLDELKAL